MDDVFGEVISSYSRAQAIADGVLVDVSADAREAGFTFPVAMTVEAYGEAVGSLNGNEDLPAGQSKKGRLWDVLAVLALIVKTRKSEGDRIDYNLSVSGKIVSLYALCHGGDNGESCITIMLPHES